MVEELDAAAANLGQKLGVGAELIGREQPDLQPAAGRFANTVDGLLGSDIHRMGWILSGRELVDELGGGRRAGQNPAERDGRGRHQQRTAADASGLRDSHVFLLILH